MTPKEIIEALQEHFEDRMDQKIDLKSIGYALLDADDCKESLIEELEYNGL